MHIKKMFNAIIEKGNVDKLSDMFADFVYDTEKIDKMRYKSIEYKMHKLAYGDHLTEDQAKCWVKEMKNKDGTEGEHWTYEQAEQVRRQYASEMDPYDWYAILNMTYSDYYSPKFDTSTYVDLAKDWLTDKDIGAGKALRYYLFVVQ